MSLKKLSAATLFDGAQFIHDAVLITDRYGVIMDIVSNADAGDSIQQLDGILVPGFINAHCHLELSHLKEKIPPGSGFASFLGRVVKSRAAEPDIILNAIQEAESAMLENGIVAVGDICNTTDTITCKSKKRLYYHSFIETIGFNDKHAQSVYEKAKEVKNAFSVHLSSETSSITPHAPYSVSRSLFKLIAANENLISMHSQEDEGENQFFLEGKGPLRNLFHELNIDLSNFSHPKLSSLQAIWNYFNKHQQLLLVHNVATGAGDIEFLSKQPDNPKIYWCLCPNANLYITGNLPKIDLLEQQGKFVLGTDSLASNHQLSILEEMKTIQKNYKVTLKQLLQWATSNGAEALKISARFGSFEKGKQPGVLLIRNIQGNDLKDATVERIL